MPPITTKFPKKGENYLELFLSQRVDIFVNGKKRKFDVEIKTSTAVMALAASALS